ncbi:MAG: YceH family protein [Acidobacteria bacterium]|nr:YceH family protein [Acidobacteriota bacterium]MCI0720305.1 YceH family protein [Acidobacteriota bacterium]
MDWNLSELEARIVGSLLEKEVTTPECYPLSLNALMLACNQKTNRDPPMSLDEDALTEALETLRAKGLVCFVRETGSRVEKYRQRLSEVLNLDRREFAVLCVLMLRGFQTTGELRERTHRLYTFDDLAAVESCLNRMIERSPALAVKLARSAGSKEPRYAHLFSGTPQVVENEAVPSALPAGAAQSYGERIIALEAEVTVLKQEVASLRTQLAEFRGQFE